MTQQHINLGTQSDGKDGDTNRVAWQKTEANFNELYNGALSVATFKNRIINGSFDIWQRGTSFSSTGYCADRFLVQQTGTAISATRHAFAIGQSAVPDNPAYFMRCAVSSVAGAGNACYLAQRIEGVASLAGERVTVSFYAKADAARKIALEATQYFGSGGPASVNAIGVTSFNLTSDWQKFSATFDIPALTNTSMGPYSDDFVQIALWMDAGSNYNSRTSSLGQQSGTFDFSQVQLEIGGSATSFDARPKAIEQQLCNRYCYAFTATIGTGIGVGTQHNATSTFVPLPLPTAMRASPSMRNLGSPIRWVGAASSTTDPALGVVNQGLVCLIFTVSGGAQWSSGYAASSGGPLYLLMEAEL